MSTDLERRLRDELTGLAATTRTAPGALDAIVERAGRAPRRGKAPLVVAVATVVVLAVVALGSAGDDRAPRVTADIPPGPPEVTGTVLAEVYTVPCTGDCVDARARFPIIDPEQLEVLASDERGDNYSDGPTSRHPLRDGRFFTSEGGGALLVDPADGSSMALGRGLVTSADVLPDGRVVFVKVDDGAEVAIADPAGGTVTRVRLPGDLSPSAVAVAPDGTMAVLGEGARCCNVVLFAPDGDVSFLDVAGALDRRGIVVIGDTAMSWSVSGLLAISQDLPEPWTGASSPLQGWTVVIDPDDGERITAIDGWQGLAWSPDGRGLLVARRAGPRSSELAVYWGPELSERIDLGRVPLPVLPRFWLP